MVENNRLDGLEYGLYKGNTRGVVVTRKENVLSLLFFALIDGSGGVVICFVIVENDLGKWLLKRERKGKREEEEEDVGSGCGEFPFPCLSFNRF